MKLAANPSVAAAAAGDVRAAVEERPSRVSEECNVPSAPLAAELLLMHVLQRDRAWLYAHPEYELSPDQTLQPTRNSSSAAAKVFPRSTSPAARSFGGSNSRSVRVC